MLLCGDQPESARGQEANVKGEEPEVESGVHEGES